MTQLFDLTHDLLIGIKDIFTFAFNDDHQVNAEIIFQYNYDQKVVGISDLKLGYGHLFYKNYNKLFSAFSLDGKVNIPTGTPDNRFGYGYFGAEIFITVGFSVSKSHHFFPSLGVDFQKQKISDSEELDLNELNVSSLPVKITTSFILSDRLFFQVNPPFVYLFVENEKKYQAEFIGNLTIFNSIHGRLEYLVNITDQQHIVQGGFTIYYFSLIKSIKEKFKKNKKWKKEH